MVAHFGLDVVKAYMGHVQDNAEASVRRLLARLSDGHFRVGMDNGAAVEVRDHHRPREALGEGRLLRHERAAGVELQRARAGHARRRALHLPRHGGRADPHERRLPEADRDRHPRRLHAEARLSRCRRRRQRRDQPGRDQRALCRAQCARLHARHHEQPHLRQRQAAVLRDAVLGRARRAWLRRRRRRARAHDQHAPHRP